MKIKLAVSRERYDEIARELKEKGIEIDDTADLMISEAYKSVNFLSVREAKEEGERRHVAVEDIICIESFGHTVEVRCRDGLYQTTDRLYQLMLLLDPKQFIRISNSVIVNRSQIQHISPTFSQKFILTLKDGTRADVTRSYYNEFKKIIGI